jgi:hypothetical protein
MSVKSQSPRVLPYPKLLEVGHPWKMRGTFPGSDIIPLYVHAFCSSGGRQLTLVELEADSD